LSPSRKNVDHEPLFLSSASPLGLQPPCTFQIIFGFFTDVNSPLSPLLSKIDKLAELRNYKKLKQYT